MNAIIETIRPLYDYIFSLDFYVGLVMGFAMACVFYWVRWKKGG
jgi:hypothetical protein